MVDMSTSEQPLHRIIHKGADLVMGQVAETCVSIWRNQPSARTFGVQRSELTRVVRQSPGRAAFVCVIEPSCGPMDDTLRKATAEMMAELGGNLRAVAGIIEATGFMASITRSILVGIQLLTRAPAPTKYFRTVEEAALWLFPAGGGAEQLIHAVAVFRTCFTSASAHLPLSGHQ